MTPKKVKEEQVQLDILAPGSLQITSTAQPITWTTISTELPICDREIVDIPSMWVVPDIKKEELAGVQLVISHIQEECDRLLGDMERVTQEIISDPYVNRRHPEFYSMDSTRKAWLDLLERIKTRFGV